MSEEESEETQDEQPVCGADLETAEGVCDRTATQPDGKCGYHTVVDNSMEENWQPTYKHGLYLDRSGYYESIPEGEQEWIDAVSDDLLGKSKFTDDDLSALEKCRQVAIDLHQKRRADEFIAKEGMTQTNTTGYHEEYGPIEETTEHTLFITKDRLSRETRMTMKDLGIFDQEESSDGASDTLVEKLSDAIEEDED